MTVVVLFAQHLPLLEVLEQQHLDIVVMFLLSVVSQVRGPTIWKDNRDLKQVVNLPVDKNHEGSYLQIIFDLDDVA